ncbi:alpha/beta hydrolase family protein [Actinorugispora endophytica]|uniref:Platelet-activating factor acetylhydrolase isoform II n=1 Tax=Actinorugispora endophytica TaxID=1605990 RepID=A0A4R6V3R1_9ACTN|nr:alpha/beta hydrolase [Actinorugispora endophytica]TDQ55025.1 platelet-activating factor acetylhydrolase isoform II [Actinorugispora endophytica]
MTDRRSFSPRRHRVLFHGAAAAVLAASCAVPSAFAAVTDPDPVRLVPPEPTGPHAVGRVELHLAEEGRGHPWVEGVERRELMATLWYPAEGGGGERARYVPDSVAGVLAGELEQVGLSRDAVDFAGSYSNAVVGADVAPDAGRLPVLLYSPGFNQTRHQATAQLEELASRGYAVAAVDHPYETSAVEFPDGRVVRDSVPGSGAETLRAAVGTRVADVRLVLDALEEIAEGGDPRVDGRPLPEGLGRALDPSAVGMFGHSAGGFTTAEAMLGDDRLDAGANLDGSMAYHVGDEEWAESTVRGADRPFMIIGGGTTSPGSVPRTSEHSPDWRMFREASTGPSLELYLEEGEHMGFTDLQWQAPQVEAGARPGGPAWEDTMRASVGTVDPGRGIAAQRAYLTAFFDEYVRGEERPLLDGPSGEHPDVAFVG